jgi:hypothetical protein|tara:strand:+ start:6082 stop:6729 length:648 start_codon:yes stop_codon:yes gene_type:complete
MSTRIKIWLLPSLLYAIFVLWYTDFGGPLSDEEVDNFQRIMVANGSRPERVQYFTAFARNDSGRQFLMINNIDMNKNPPAVEGAPANADADTLMGLYMEHMIPELLKRACHPLIMGPAVYSVIDIVGIEDGEQWTNAAVVRYRSRRSFMEIISNPEILGPHDFKLAALDKTIAYPIETDLYLGDPRLLLGLMLLALTALLDGWMMSRNRGHTAYS